MAILLFWENIGDGNITMKTYTIATPCALPSLSIDCTFFPKNGASRQLLSDEIIIKAKFCQKNPFEFLFHDWIFSSPIHQWQ